MIEREDRDGGVAILRLNHGKASAFDTELLGELEKRFTHPDARAIVLTGTGSIFSAGVDLFRLVKEGRPYVERFVPLLSKSLEAIFTCPVPVVSAVNGHAIAGGYILNAAADYRLMASGTGRIGIPELLVGVPFPAMALEIARFGTPSIEEMVYTGKTITAEEALAKGIVHEVLPAADLQERALAVATQMARLPPRAFAMTKAQLRQPSVKRARELAREDAESVEIWADAKTHEHIRGYLERTLSGPRRG